MNEDDLDRILAHGNWSAMDVIRHEKQTSFASGLVVGAAFTLAVMWLCGAFA